MDFRLVIVPTITLTKDNIEDVLKELGKRARAKAKLRELLLKPTHQGEGK